MCTCGNCIVYAPNRKYVKAMFVLKLVANKLTLDALKKK